MAATRNKQAHAEEDKPPTPAKKTPPPAKTDWKRWIGWAKDDPTYEEALRIGAEYRRGLTWEKEEHQAGRVDS